MSHEETHLLDELGYFTNKNENAAEWHFIYNRGLRQDFPIRCFQRRKSLAREARLAASCDNSNSPERRS